MSCGPHWEGGSRLRLPRNSVTDEAPARYFLESQAQAPKNADSYRAVSYTHLTLPTILLV
eukprot:7842251-Pyramimonas_sp.AAC.1